jgi:hypothetical protein
MVTWEFFVGIVPGKNLPYGVIFVHPMKNVYFKRKKPESFMGSRDSTGI